jgi:carbamate kinase
MATKIDQIALKYQIPSHKNIPNFQIQVTQKYTKIGHFGVQSYVPSGNPVYTY